MTIGQRIKQIKVSLNMTSAEMAEKLGIPVRTIGSYERDEAQPGAKFFTLLIETFQINVNWLLTGEGNMFMTSKREVDIKYLAQINEQLNLTAEELEGLIDILDADASRDMVMKFIEIKKGNKEALDSLIQNLQGIKAIYN
jgi:transcriptional regulator with XRE-family HTH domain